MCGIAGMLLKSSLVVTEKMLQTMACKQQHRGPDNFSTWYQDNVGFAHNRLSIIDLSSAGNQPFCNERYVLTYNGEIYNYLELRKELLKKGVVFRSTSDTEVLFEHLVHFGVEKTLLAIKGMFAFSFYDLYEKIVYLCRDRLGIKPLVWIYNETGLYWASEVKALTAVTKISPDPAKTLFSAASIGEKSNSYTVFKDVKKVPPGSYLVCKSDENPQSIEYYDITQDVDENYYRELNQMSSETVLGHFEDILKRSVKSMLMSDAPMGVFVSGGIDSSLIALLATQYNPNLALFTANVIGKHSEYPDAQLLSESIKRPLHAQPFKPEMMLYHWAEATYHYECPIVIHTNAIPFSTVSQLARQKKVKAVLTGEGSDELFLGYPKLLTKRFKKWASAPIEWPKAVYNLIPGLKEYLFPSATQSILGFFELLVQGFERQRLREEGYEAYHFLPSPQIPDHYLSIQMIREGLVALLHRNDSMGMMASIESRFPFLDEEMIRFAVNLPLKYKTGRSWHFHNYKHPFLIDKAIVRRAAEKHLPSQLVYKKKNGFPMYGHKNIRVKPGYFIGGYVAQLVGLSSEAEAYMLRTQSPYYIAKLVSVDIFGRLFAFGETPSEISERILNYVTLKT